MKDIFYRKLQNKTEKELRYILENQEKYQPDAVEVATDLLDKSMYKDLEIPISKADEEKRQSDFYQAAFDPSDFYRTFSHRDVLTVFTMGLLFITLFEIMTFYKNEPFIEANYKTISLWTFIFLFLLNHIFYKVEHSRSNNLIGRFYMDCLFIFFLIIIPLIYTYLLNQSLDFHLNYNFGQFIVVMLLGVLALFLVEAVVGIIKHLLIYLKCGIL